MALIDPAQVMGDVVKMVRTSPGHLAGFGERAATAGAAAVPVGIEGRFGALLGGVLDGVNDSQLRAMDLSQRMITDPGSVNVEDVTIALADANLALSMTKAIVDRALAAYREIINIR